MQTTKHGVCAQKVVVGIGFQRVYIHLRGLPLLEAEPAFFYALGGTELEMCISRLSSSSDMLLPTALET